MQNYFSSKMFLDSLTVLTFPVSGHDHFVVHYTSLFLCHLVEVLVNNAVFLRFWKFTLVFTKTDIMKGILEVPTKVCWQLTP